MLVRNILRSAAVLQLSIMLLALPTQAFCRQDSADPTKLSAEEREWFETFQRGTFFAPGWREITEELVEKAPPELKSELKKTLDALGTRIGCEWSRRNDIRRIDNDMLARWGRMLRQAAEQEPEQIPQVVANLNRKVVTLLD